MLRKLFWALAALFVILVQVFRMPVRAPEKPSIDPESLKRGHEIHDVSAVGIMIFSIAFVVAAVAMHVALYGVFRGLRNWQRSSMDESYPPPADPNFAKFRRLPPGPRLQKDPQADYEKFHESQMRAINSYRWVDKKAGIATIPIDRAMEILSHGR